MFSCFVGFSHIDTHVHTSRLLGYNSTIGPSVSSVTSSASSCGLVVLVQRPCVRGRVCQCFGGSTFTLIVVHIAAVVCLAIVFVLHFNDTRAQA